MIIAVDGPAASGKGTIAKALAVHYGLPHLDTGLLYRAVGLAVLEGGGDPASPDDALHAANHLASALDDPGLKSEAAGKAASLVSAHPGVRAALLERQKRFANQAGGAVLDGRDIGTVIAPEAEAKLFVVASVKARAQRRFLEMQGRGAPVTLDEIEADLAARDERDRSRAAAPLVAASDAVTLDTSALSIETAIDAAIALVEQRRAR